MRVAELFHTERAHLRNLKVLDLLFNGPMQQENSGVMCELARALFPNIEEVIALHGQWPVCGLANHWWLLRFSPRDDDVVVEYVVGCVRVPDVASAVVRVGGS